MSNNMETDNATPTPEMSTAQQMAYDAEREMREKARNQWKSEYKQIVWRINNAEGSLKEYRTELDEHMKKDPNTLRSETLTRDPRVSYEEYQKRLRQAAREKE